MLFLPVALDVPCNLLHPEISVGLGDGIVPATLMAMPEAPIYEDTSAVLAEYNVRMPWQTRIVHPITKAFAPQIFSDDHLRLRVFSFDSRHVFMAL
jgi:hypothetical protein